MAFSLLANSSSEVDKNHISFRTVDFQPHLSNFTPIFERMDQDMDLTIESLNFRVGSLGLIRLSDPVSPNLSASEAKTVAMSESLVGSSSEANSPVSFTIIEIAEGKIAEVDENMENFDLGDQIEDLMICHDDTSDKSTDTWETG
jgi:dethiobiotin synthetase